MMYLTLKENHNKPQTKSAKVICAVLKSLSAIQDNPKISEEELMGIIRSYTGDDENLTGATCALIYVELEKRKARKDA